MAFNSGYRGTLIPASSKFIVVRKLNGKAIRQQIGNQKTDVIRYLGQTRSSKWLYLQRRGYALKTLNKPKSRHIGQCLCTTPTSNQQLNQQQRIKATICATPRVTLRGRTESNYDMLQPDVEEQRQQSVNERFLVRIGSVSLNCPPHLRPAVVLALYGSQHYEDVKLYLINTAHYKNVLVG